jgi:hypothetical protein
LIVPLLVGLFWGAPVVAREIEHDTHRLLWTQGISRRRWALAKAGLLGGAVTAFAVVYGLGAAWWYEPLGRVDVRQSRFTQVFFDLQGVTPGGYPLFAVALGVFAGTVAPRVLPSMALTLAGFVGARVAVALLRPHYMAPVAGDQLIEGTTRGGRARRELGAGQGGAAGRRHVHHRGHCTLPGQRRGRAVRGRRRPRARRV